MTKININNKLLNSKILWTNPSPTSIFGTQTITLSSDDYDMLEIFYYSLKEDKTMTSIRIIKGENMYIPFTRFGGQQNYGIAVGYRIGTHVSDTEYTFAPGLCYWTNLNSENRYTYNDCAIPIYIVGYKTGLFK